MWAGWLRFVMVMRTKSRTEIEIVEDQDHYGEKNAGGGLEEVLVGVEGRA